ncbi:MAG: hypothetical protein V4541_13825 [Bacteroidota bacterium]
MKSKRNFIISCVLIAVAGFFSILAWTTYQEASSITIMVLAAVLFMAGVVVFALNFRE